jgi:hypothetical protein
MKRILLLSVTLVLMFAFSGNVLAQRTVTGSVVGEEDGTPIPGVNVILKGASVGTVTDIDGTYQIAVPDEGESWCFPLLDS